MRNLLSFQVFKEDAQNFPKSRYGGGEYFHTEYEVALVFTGDEMVFELILPRTGVFPSPYAHGPNPIKVTRKYDSTGVFGLTNFAAA